MLKHRELHECHELYTLLSHPTVLPYVRQQAYSVEEYWLMTYQLLVEEQQGKTISRTILNDQGRPIGTINLFDIHDGAGFLGTWIGLPYQGKGYNEKAKTLFLHELFFQLHFHTVFLKIRTTNEKSQKAVHKLPYTLCANESHAALFEEINRGEFQYDLFQIPKDIFCYTANSHIETAAQLEI